MRRSILWFRNDLRLHDNEALSDALSHSDEVIPLYVLDPRIIEGKTSCGLPKTGQHRHKFLMESLMDLRSSLRKLGSDLYIREGLPEEIIPEVARKVRSAYVYCNRERTFEEVGVQDRLEQNLWVIGQEIRYFRGKMLYYTADLPFPITHCPDTFTAFRKEVEKFVPIRNPLKTPSHINPVSVELEPGDLSIPDDNVTGDRPSVLIGGESEALKHLKYYLWDSKLVSKYKETRNNLLGRDFSSKFSSYLANGALSPKLIYTEVKRYEREIEKNKSTYWLVFELMWRDFFRFMAKKHGDKIFHRSGTKGVLRENLYDNETLFSKWTAGKTGIPFIDANIRELNATGYMSNRGRQNVASFLVNDLKINWIWGAEYFESQLLDYDPCSNYGNWNYIAGVGADPREDRYFNIPVQARKYDPAGEYIRHWLPELKDAPLKFLFNPFSISREDYDPSGHYPSPCIEVKKWLA